MIKIVSFGLWLKSPLSRPKRTSFSTLFPPLFRLFDTMSDAPGASGDGVGNEESDELLVKGWQESWGEPPADGEVDQVWDGVALTDVQRRTFCKSYASSVLVSDAGEGLLTAADLELRVEPVFPEIDTVNSAKVKTWYGSRMVSDSVDRVIVLVLMMIILLI